MAERRPSGALFVALGILTSRVFGLVREKAISWFFGVGPHADVLRNAFRAPNLLQNMLGEQTLSASFIPVFSRMLEEGREEEAGRFAGAVFGLLTATVFLIASLGVIFARPIVSVLSAGFLGDAELVASGELSVDRFELTVRAVRWIFPMTGFLVLSAWALGILNSHRRFLLPYLSPVVWNCSILSVLGFVAWQSGLFGAPREAPVPMIDRWLFAVCAGALLGGALQFAVQLPLVLKLLRGFVPSLNLRAPGVREALATLGPALAGRGVVQISLYLDLFLANFLAAGAPGAIGYAIVLVNLPLGVFAMSVAAAELPELSRASEEEAKTRIPERIDRALRQSVFVIAPSVIGYIVFGFLVAGLLFRGGRFTVEANLLVWLVLCGYTVGLLASTISRLLQNAFFALRDTKTPARTAAARVAFSGAVGALLMLQLDRFAVGEVFGLAGESQGLRLGALGLSLAAGLAGWCELTLLLRALKRRIPNLRLPYFLVFKRFALAAASAIPALLLWALLREQSILIVAPIVLPLYAATYLGSAWLLKLPEWEMWLGRFGRSSSET